tara:strand:+ start:2136 stop:2576 length:441 start_codon:yes stop_codon:yes gene_type:complete
MFSHDTVEGRAVCLESYGSLKKGAVVPETNELYADVESWLAEGNQLADFSGYPEVPMSEEQLQQWRESASVTSRQGEQQLIIAGLDEQVEAAIGAIEDPLQRKLTSAWYRRASTWERMNPEFIALGQALGLTDEQMDEHIREAMKL